MEKERIHFEKYNHPILLWHLHMCEGQPYREMHSHNAIEIVLVNSGILQCYVNDDIVIVHPGQVIFINRNQIHRLFSKNAELIYFQIDTGLLEANENDDESSKLYAFISRTQAKPYLVPGENGEIIRLLHKIDSKYNDDAKENRWYIKAYAYELIAYMYSQSFIMPLTISIEKTRKIDEIVEFIDKNFLSPITLDDIYMVSKYSKFSICHIFKQITGSTIFEYINFLRACYAAEILKGTGNSISAIATQCGFTSATYFNRVFKVHFGCPPSIYRKLLHKNIID